MSIGVPGEASLSSDVGLRHSCSLEAVSVEPDVNMYESEKRYEREGTASLPAGSSASGSRWTRTCGERREGVVVSTCMQRRARNGRAPAQAAASTCADPRRGSGTPGAHPSASHPPLPQLTTHPKASLQWYRWTRRQRRRWRAPCRRASSREGGRCALGHSRAEALAAARARAPAVATRLPGSWPHHSNRLLHPRDARPARRLTRAHRGSARGAAENG